MFYNRQKTVFNHGNMPLFYMYTQDKKHKAISNSNI